MRIYQLGKDGQTIRDFSVAFLTLPSIGNLQHSPFDESIDSYVKQALLPVTTPPKILTEIHPFKAE